MAYLSDQGTPGGLAITMQHNFWRTCSKTTSSLQVAATSTCNIHAFERTLLLWHLTTGRCCFVLIGLPLSKATDSTPFYRGKSPTLYGPKALCILVLSLFGIFDTGSCEITHNHVSIRLATAAILHPNSLCSQQGCISLDLKFMFHIYTARTQNQFLPTSCISSFADPPDLSLYQSRGGIYR